ncbi:S41 family peptidase [Ferrimonas pelagia]|uniref:S41 family peptidase n=1 Tax=Ferrimonas pelagia TaxID=1177826 RepID=A0ABP9FFB7_9GAMM
MAALLTLLCLITPVAAADDLTQQEKLFGLSLLWKELSYNFPFFDQVPDLDIDQAYQTFIPKVLATESTAEYYRELVKFVAQFDDGHTQVIPPRSYQRQYRANVPIQLTAVQGQAIVTAVSGDLSEQLPLGAAITAVNGLALQSHLDKHILPYIASSASHVRQNMAIRSAFEGRPDTALEITFRTVEGETGSVSVTRRHKLAWGTASVLQQPKRSKDRLDFRMLDNDIGYLSLSTFRDKAIVDDFLAIFAELKTTQGLLIDLRFNGGGNSRHADEIIRYLADRNTTGRGWKSRIHSAAYKSWGVYGGQYAEYGQDNAWHQGKPSTLTARSNNHIVPTYVLIGPGTASSSENFLIHASQLQHMTTIGENTFGSTGNPLIYDLPGGGKARIVSLRATFHDGREFVGSGIAPDIEIKPTLADLLAEEDVVLNEAIRRLSEQL